MIEHSNILIMNTGSSSIKLALLAMPDETVIAHGIVESIGGVACKLTWYGKDQESTFELADSNHDTAMQEILRVLFLDVGEKLIAAVGHRVVHGGERFTAPTLLNQHVIEEIDRLSYLAPLHNPANVLGIHAVITQLPNIPHIAVFDTAFHHRMPKEASMYAVPYQWYHEYGVRRYGFHGSSHHYVAEQASAALKRSFEDCKLLTVHLGNGCSAAAISDGYSIDTTMGMTPLEGLVMGTRSGDIDPSLHEFMAQQAGMSLAEITHILNRSSGLLGLSGVSNDMRDLLKAAASGHKRAQLAIDVFCYRLAKSLAGLAAALGQLDGIIFTGGIGEHAHLIREETVARLAIFGVELDLERNRHHGSQSGGMISKEGADIAVLVIATNEEVMIARHVRALMHTEVEK